MSAVVVCPTVLRRDQLGTSAMPVASSWLTELVKPLPEKQKEAEETFDIWSSIQKEKEMEKEKEREKAVLPSAQIPYVHPMMRRASSLMSQKSLEICTESLGSETGSDGFSSGDELQEYSYSVSPFYSKTGEEEEEDVEDDFEEGEDVEGKEEVAAVNYHCSIGRRSPLRSFPPPLPSISRRDGTCLKMQPHRCNGRLILEAVPIPSNKYLHAERHGGRLLLSFIATSSKSSSPVPTAAGQSHIFSQKEFDAEAEEEEEEVVEEEEVEVVDRGTIVEVKVSTQPQPVSGAAAVKVHRSSLVINKFVIGSPLPELDSSPLTSPTPLHNYTTVAAAAVAASSISTPTSTTEGFHYNYLHHHHDSPWGPLSPAAAAAADAKLLFASKRRSREELLHDMRRCSELRRPLFIFEQPHCIATSS